MDFEIQKFNLNEEEEKDFLLFQKRQQIVQQSRDIKRKELKKIVNIQGYTAKQKRVSQIEDSQESGDADDYQYDMKKRSKYQEMVDQDKAYEEDMKQKKQQEKEQKIYQKKKEKKQEIILKKKQKQLQQLEMRQSKLYKRASQQRQSQLSFMEKRYSISSSQGGSQKSNENLEQPKKKDSTALLIQRISSGVRGSQLPVQERSDDDDDYDENNDRYKSHNILNEISQDQSQIQSEEDSSETSSQENSILTQDISIDISTDSQEREERDQDRQIDEYIRNRDRAEWKQHQLEKSFLQEKKNQFLTHEEGAKKLEYERKQKQRLEEFKKIIELNKKEIQMINSHVNESNNIANHQLDQNFSVNENDSQFLQHSEEMWRLRSHFRMKKQQQIVEKQLIREENRKQFVQQRDPDLNEEEHIVKVNKIMMENRKIAEQLMWNAEIFKKISLDCFNYAASEQKGSSFLTPGQVLLAVEDFFRKTRMHNMPKDDEQSETDFGFHMDYFFTQFENRQKIFFHDFFYFLRKSLQIIIGKYKQSEHEVKSFRKQQMCDYQNSDYLDQFNGQIRYGPGF